MICFAHRIASRRASWLLALAAGVLAPLHAGAQPPGSPLDNRSARERAVIDITGQWVAVINEDWRWRMITPPVGDTASVPLNGAGIAAAADWDLERDAAEGNLCRAFGPPGLIRQPTRIRIDWEDDDTLLLEFDAGRQTRRLEFGPPSPPDSPSLQGYSAASWFRQRQARAVFAPNTLSAGGSLHVRTTQLAPGYLRPNGVPYSEQTTLMEYFNTFTLPGAGGSWLIVTTVVNDPVNLTAEFVISTQFRKETRRANWSPRPCEIAAPLADEAQPVSQF
jgi:hypothetical protein